MPASTTKSTFLRGALASLPFVIVVGPFALLFGVVATEAGLDLTSVMAFSALVIAGASQFTALQLMVDDAHIWVILATSLAVNLRMAMYSASLAPWLGAAPLWQRALIAYLNVDQTYALAISIYEREPRMPLRHRVATFLGLAAPIAPAWYLCTWLGAELGQGIPDSFALDFALPITFIAMVAPMLRTLAHVAAACVSVVLSLLLASLPPGLGLLLAGAAAMATGAAVEAAMERKRAPA